MQNFVTFFGFGSKAECVKNPAMQCSSSL